MDAKDRHVLAATISVDADILLTQNTKHFPRTWMTERGIELRNAGELLTRLAEHFPEKIQAAHQQAVRTSRKPEAEILSTSNRSSGSRSPTLCVHSRQTTRSSSLRIRRCPSLVPEVCLSK